MCESYICSRFLQATRPILDMMPEPEPAWLCIQTDATAEGHKYITNTGLWVDQCQGLLAEAIDIALRHNNHTISTALANKSLHWSPHHPVSIQHLPSTCILFRIRYCLYWLSQMMFWLFLNICFMTIVLVVHIKKRMGFSKILLKEWFVFGSLFSFT